MVVEGIRSGKTRLLELYKDKIREEDKTPPCNKCKQSERVGKILFCQISGKIILPMFEDISCCHGKYLEENNV